MANRFKDLGSSNLQFILKTGRNDANKYTFCVINFIKINQKK